MAVFCSCSNSVPSVASVEAKLVYDFENENKVPVQKLNVFVKMTSDVRRVDSLKICHSETGYRWNVVSPLISQVDSNYYAGYTNLQGPSSSGIPSGEYSVYYMDAAGREDFSQFTVYKSEEYDNIKLKDFQKTLKGLNAEIYIGIYSDQSKLVYYGKPKNDWNVSLEYEKCDAEHIFASYREGSSFRIFYHVNGNIYIMPRVYKEEGNSPSEEMYSEAEQKKEIENDR